MDIKASLIEDRSNENVWRIAHYVASNPSELEVLWGLIVNLEDPNLRMRSAWALGKVVEIDASLVNPVYDKIVALLTEDIDFGVRRSLLRSLAFSVVQKKYYVVLFDLCSGYIANPNQPVAIRMYSMKICRQIVKAIPELGPELMALLVSVEQSIDTSGLKNIYSKTLKWLEKFI